MDNLLANLPPDLASELLETVLETRGVRIERIVSTGHASPPDFWYDQDEGEWVVVLQGEAILQIEHEPDRHLVPGDHVWLAPHCRHRVKWTSPTVPTVWLAVFIVDA